MARIEDGAAGSGVLTVEPGTNAARVSLVPRGYGFAVAATTGTIAAALGANSTLFAMRLSPTSPRRAFIDSLRLEFTCIVAYTTPVTVGRRLALYTGTIAANPTGGTAIAVPQAKHGTANTSNFAAAQGGDIRIASTGSLTAAATLGQQFRELSLVHVGAAGAFREAVWEFASGAESQPPQLEPGGIIVIRNPVAMDAAGTWQLSVAVDWHEAPAMDYTG